MIKQITIINLLLCGCLSAFADILPAERAALLQLFNATNGKEWKMNHNWATNEPVFSWYGITISGDGQHITAIDLSKNHLVGALPNIYLPELKFLYLGENQLSGSIPNFELPKLTELQLNDNELSGTVPNFSGMPELLALSLRDNQLSGSIPNFSALPLLQKLYLSKNDFSGTLPDFAALQQLQELYINKTQISGSIPDFNLPQLKKLELCKNSLSGTVTDFSHLPALTFLDLRSNYFEGQLTDFHYLPQLRVLRITNNDLTSLPDFSSLPNLQTLSVGYNKLTEVPNFSHLPKLQALTLNNNLLKGNLPVFTHLFALEALSLSFNQLSGTIPNFDNYPHLKILQLDYNEFEGEIPNFQYLSGLTKLYLNNNHLSGTVPSFKGFGMLEMDLSYNQLTFAGIEKNCKLTTSFWYDQQEQIPLQYVDGKLWVQAGGDLKNNTYEWYLNEQLVASVVGDNSYLPTTEGIYRCEVTNKVAQKLRLVSHNKTVAATTLNNYALVESVKVYPNFTNAMVNIDYTVANEGNVKITLLDLAGQPLLTQQYGNETIGTHTQTLDLSQLPTAYYLVVVDNGQAKYTEKVLKVE